MPDEDIALFQEMLERAYVCRQFIGGRIRSDLDDDLLLYYAVAKAVELIGEAAWHVSDPTRIENPGIDWNNIVGMRHRLVHGFSKVIRDILWEAAQDDMPILIGQLQAALASRDG